MVTWAVMTHGTTNFGIPWLARRLTRLAAAVVIEITILQAGICVACEVTRIVAGEFDGAACTRCRCRCTNDHSEEIGDHGCDICEMYHLGHGRTWLALLAEDSYETTAHDGREKSLKANEDLTYSSHGKPLPKALDTPKQRKNGDTIQYEACNQEAAERGAAPFAVNVVLYRSLRHRHYGLARVRIDCGRGVDRGGR